MKKTFVQNIADDLAESKMNGKVFLAFIPIAFSTYLFHEFGHWTFGELTGNSMMMSINNAAPANGTFKQEGDALWSAIGGPVFTILQGLLFLAVTWFTKSVYAYATCFFSMFSRVFSLVFGGLSLQDEGRIASMLHISEYLPAAIVIAVLLLIVWKSTTVMKLKRKAVGYFLVAAVCAVLIVIATSKLMG